MRVRVGEVAALAAAAAMSAALAAPARGALPAPVRLGSWADTCSQCGGPFYFSRPRLAEAPGGAAIAEWPGALIVRRAGGSWQPLPEPSPEAPGPSLAVGPGASAVAAWSSAREVETAFLQIGHGGWSRTQAVADPRAEALDAAVDAHGNAALVWLDRVPGEPHEAVVRVCRHRAGANGWQAPVTLAGGPASPARRYVSFAGAPRLAFDGRGRLTVLWEETRRPAGKRGEWLIRSATSSAQGRWSAAASLARSSSRILYGPALAVDRRGDALATWIAGGAGAVMEASTWAARMPGWRAPVRVLRSENGFEQTPSDTRVSIADDGQTLVAASVFGGSGRAGIPVQAVLGSAVTGRWQKPVSVGVGTEATLAGDAQGDAILAWVEAKGGPAAGPPAEQLVAVARKPAHGRWGHVERLSPSGVRDFKPVVALGARGEQAIAIWLRRGGSVLAAQPR